MNCTQCGAENPDEANFCGSCGISIGSAFDSPSGPISSLGGHDEDEANADIAATGGAEVEPPAMGGPPTPKAAPQPPSFSEPMPIPTQMPEPTPPPLQPEAAPVHRQTPPVNPNHPGAGLAPPPPPVPGGYAQQQQAQSGYGYSMPTDGNTSGMGEGYQVPPEAEGWTFGSFIPWGLFSFINGNNLWGILYWVSSFFGLTIVYWVYVGLNGKKQAWQGRRFDNMQQYVDTMKAWNTWGIVCLVLSIIGTTLYCFLFVLLVMFDETGY